MPIPINAYSYLVTRLSVYRTDSRRIGLFVAAVAQKAVELERASSISGVAPAAFMADASELVAKWADKSIDVSKNPLRYLFTDPFRGLRDETRKFAQDWDLDASFRGSLGV